LTELLEALAGDLSELGEADLAELLAELQAEAETVAAGDLNDEILAAITAAADTGERIAAELAGRQAAADARSAEAAAALDRLRGTNSDPDPEPEPEPEPEPDEPEAEVAEPEPVTAEVAEPEAEPAPVAIAAATPARQPVVSRVAARRPAPRAQTAPLTTTRPVGEWGLVAAANAPGVSAGAPIRDARQLAEAFLGAWEASRGWTGSEVKVPLARIGRRATEAEYGDRFLDFDPVRNEAKLARYTSPEAITAYWNSGEQRELRRREGRTAAGGICAPLEIRYDIPAVGSTARPARDQAMTRFPADRGGVRTIPPPVIGDMTAGLSVWTEENDQNPSSPTTKPCLTMTCPEDDETVVDAITRCLKVGNFRARYFPEQVEAWMEKLAVAHARLAETTLITAIGAGSTQVTVGQTLGTTRNILAGLDRLVAGMRYRHRLDALFPLTFAYPRWLLDNVRADIARQMPVGTLDETLALADAEIESWFASRSVRGVALLDGESGQGFGAQPDGHALPWPSTVVTYLYPSGSWLFLDGGELNVGMYRDSGLVETNDYKFFAETFEAAHFHGVESQRVTFDICPDGSASALIDIDPCTTGS